MQVLVRLVLSFSLTLTPPVSGPQACDSASVASLPLIERPATTDTGQVLVVMLTGDGGWAHADEEVSAALLARGGALVGLNMRSYLSRRRTPDEFAHVVECVARTWMARWHREYFMLLGYSRGADLAPFAVTRLPADLRPRLTMVALVSPGSWAGFQFHLIDLVRDVHRADDLPVLPELAAITAVPVTCIYGRKDAGSACPMVDSTRVRVEAREGGHRITGGFDVMAEVLAAGLRPRK